MTRGDIALLRRQLVAVVSTLDRMLAERPVRPRTLAGQGREHRVKAVLTMFDAAWARRYGQTYKRTTAGAEARAAKSIADEPPARVAAWIDAYLLSSKPWLVESRHPFALFVRTINEWRAARLPQDESSRTGVPDADQTRAYLERMRASAR